MEVCSPIFMSQRINCICILARQETEWSVRSMSKQNTNYREFSIRSIE